MPNNLQNAQTSFKQATVADFNYDYIYNRDYFKLHQTSWIGGANIDGSIDNNDKIKVNGVAARESTNLYWMNVSATKDDDTTTDAFKKFMKILIDTKYIQPFKVTGTYTSSQLGSSKTTINDINESVNSLYYTWRYKNEMNIAFGVILTDLANAPAPATQGGGALKQYVVLKADGRRRLVHSAGRSKYLVVSGAHVPLSQLKGQYKRVP